MDMTPDSNPTLPTAPIGAQSEVDLMEALDEHRPSLRKLVASKLNGQGEAAIDDVLQEVAIATQGLGSRTVEASRVGAWLRQVATHKVQDYWRGMGRRRRLHSELAEGMELGSEPMDSPYEWVVRLERGRSVVEALRGLSKEDRIILEQKYLHGRSYVDIAGTLGITLKALEYRLTRARQAMRQSLDSAMEDPSHKPIS